MHKEHLEGLLKTNVYLILILSYFEIPQNLDVKNKRFKTGTIFPPRKQKPTLSHSKESSAIKKNEFNLIFSADSNFQVCNSKLNYRLRYTFKCMDINYFCIMY